jgi:hypothetical protein
VAHKKEKPQPIPCTCGALPGVAKVKNRGYILACINFSSCRHCPSSGVWPNEDQAVEKWNARLKELQEKDKRLREELGAT